MNMNIAMQAYGGQASTLFVRQPRVGASTLGDTKKTELPPMLNRQPPDFARAGFGEGTVSMPGVAIRTIGRGMESARRIVPTVEELRAEVRERLARQREARLEEMEQPRQVVATRIELFESARKTAGAINLAIGGGDPKGGPTLSIGGQVSKYPSMTDTESNEPRPAPSFDVTA